MKNEIKKAIEQSPGFFDYICSNVSRQYKSKIKKMIESGEYNLSPMDEIILYYGDLENLDSYQQFKKEVINGNNTEYTNHNIDYGDSIRDFNQSPEVEFPSLEKAIETVEFIARFKEHKINLFKRDRKWFARIERIRK